MFDWHFDWYDNDYVDSNTWLFNLDFLLSSNLDQLLSINLSHECSLFIKPDGPNLVSALSA